MRCGRHTTVYPSARDACTHAKISNSADCVVTLHQALSSRWRDSRVSVRPPQHMALDSVTGLDPEGVALRATEGLFGVDYFFPVRLFFQNDHHALSVSRSISVMSFLVLSHTPAV